ncbi:nucleotide exchange factor GrpE [Actinacidiphila soli]|uniref:nucleotide exchange factor GrpE n=1 Tax=Actinacidiphila soli TaxID=2487275 RepID=UPI000FCBDAD3|nr:nucleotide exchange factor GrpE [Actinacidiphila soli]
MTSRHEPQPPPTHKHAATAPPEPQAAPDAPKTAEAQEKTPGTPRATSAPDEYTEALEEVQDRWRRALADLDNLRKRHARELEHERQTERARVLAALLPVVDNLELALAHAEADPDSIVEGIKAVRDQAVEILNRLGYPRQEETGIPFDPFKHEVVRVVEDPHTEPGTVVGVQRPGYGSPERQLRPMAVTVSKPRE